MSKSEKKLKANHVIGILGGGQLGRMLALAASEYGYKTHIYSDFSDCPAAQVSDVTIIGDYLDQDKLKQFAKSCDVITFEFENIPVESVETISSAKPVYPPKKALEIAQDRLNEKTLFKDLNLPVGHFDKIDSLDDLNKALSNAVLPRVLKTRRMGYDGKGQVIIKAAGEAEAAWEAIGEQPAILEEFIPFDFEFSIIAARGIDGEIKIWPISRNEHENHILKRCIIPATGISDSMSVQANEAAEKLMREIDYVGVFALELFALEKENRILLNEIAPRVHNSGHWTQNGSNISQFHQHIRAISTMPLLEAKLLAPTQMLNLIGDFEQEVTDYQANENAHIHLYGKAEARPGRKMGHINIVKFN